MKPIYQRISELLDSMEIKYNFEEDIDVFYFKMGGETSDIDVYIRIQGETLITFNAILPIRMPEYSFPELLDAINQINTDALISTLYLDKDSRKINSQSFIDTKDGDIDEENFTSFLISSIKRIDSNTEDFMKIVFGSQEKSLESLLMEKEIESGVLN